MRYYKFPHRSDWQDYGRDLIPHTYYLALEDDGLTRQRMIVYEDGMVLKYDEQRTRDSYDYLQLEFVPLKMRPTLGWEEISRDDFEEAWTAHKATNR